MTRLWLMTVVEFAVTAPARAAMITQSQSFSSAGTLTFDEFDSSLGTLQAARFEWYAYAEGFER